MLQSFALERFGYTRRGMYAIAFHTDFGWRRHPITERRAKRGRAPRGHRGGDMLSFPEGQLTARGTLLRLQRGTK